MHKRTASSYSVPLVLASAVVSVVAVIFSVRLYQAIVNRQWNEDTEFRILDTQELSINIYTPKKELISKYILPRDAYIEVPAGYGYFKIKDIPQLAEVEKKGEGLIVSSVSNAFGIPFDTTAKQLTEWDRILLWYAHTFYSSPANAVTLADMDIFTSEKRADGAEIQKVDPSKTDRYFQQDLAEKAIAQEGLTVGVFNTTSEPNVAGTLSRKLEKIGIHVIEVSNLTQELNTPCEIRAREDIKQSYTVRRMVALFPCSVSNEAPMSRFDIMVITQEVL